MKLYNDKTSAIKIDSSQRGIAWKKYAPHIDLMADLMPSYSENLEHLRRHIVERQLKGKVRVIDLGAGTGIFCQAIAELLPEAEIWHVDFDPTMNSIASQKYRNQNIDNIKVVCEHIQRMEFEQGTADLVVCVNVLYAVHPQIAILNKIRRWLKPDGTLFIIDFGRKQSALDWGLHFLMNALRGRNVRKYFQFLLFGQQITKQALKGREAQEKGEYWMHSTQEFGEALNTAGFSLDHLDSCHRGYADIAIGRPNHIDTS
jgi:ubiquinone/menaquinone biosynthesis C-methylase UbiE